MTGRTLVPFAPFGFTTVTPPITSASDEDGFVSKLNVAYRFGESALLYAQANEGFRPGGVNQVPGLNQALAPYEADSTWNYELGLKSRWLDDRIGLDRAAFRIDWDDMQVTRVSRTKPRFGSSPTQVPRASTVSSSKPPRFRSPGWKSRSAVRISTPSCRRTR